MKEIAKALLDIEAVSLRPEQPYIWASGIESPIYCDNRILMAYPDKRSLVAGAFQSLIQNEFLEVEAIAGTATAGIPHAAWVSDNMKLPMLYVRSKAKGHGKSNQVEGRKVEQQKVVVIEDLISTGGSSVEAVKALKNEGFIVLGVVAIFTYGFQKSIDTFKQAGIDFFTLTNFQELCEVAVETEKISGDQLQQVISWANNQGKS